LDGGKNRIPALIYKEGNEERKASSNGKKGAVLAKNFFPDRPPMSGQDDTTDHPPCCIADSISTEQIRRQLQRLKLYKALGPDGIPNIILTKCADLLLDRLLAIYEAMYEKNLLYDPWKHFTIVVLCKPSKPRYDLPKLYCPIALLNTMWKVLAGIAVEQLTHYTEKYHLLPDLHFSG
jgi:hypothetical protein